MARADIPSEWLCKTCGAIHSPATGLCWKCQEKLFARRHHRFMRYARMMKRRDPRWRAGTGLRVDQDANVTSVVEAFEQYLLACGFQKASVDLALNKGGRESADEAGDTTP